MERRDCVGIMDSMDPLDRRRYSDAGSLKAKECGLSDYMKASGVSPIHRSTVYLLLGAALGAEEPLAEECVFAVMKEAEFHNEGAPEMKGYLSGALRARWEEYQATLMEGIDAAVNDKINSDLLGPDPRNPAVPDADRHRIYRMIGEVRKGIKTSDDVKDDLFSLGHKHDLPVGTMMAIVHAMEPPDNQ